MNCPICGNPSSANLKLHGICLCKDCYDFFNLSLISKSSTYLKFMLDDYVEKLSAYGNKDFVSAVEPVLEKYAIKCGGKVDHAKLMQEGDEGAYEAPATEEQVAAEEPGTNEKNEMADSIQITTLDHIPGYEIVKTYGIATDATAGFFKIKGGLTGILMQNSATILGPVNQTLAGLKDKAIKMSGGEANAVLGVSYQVVQTAEGGYTVFAIGTAARLGKKASPV